MESKWAEPDKWFDSYAITSRGFKSSAGILRMMQDESGEIDLKDKMQP